MYCLIPVPCFHLFSSFSEYWKYHRRTAARWSTATLKHYNYTLSNINDLTCLFSISLITRLKDSAGFDVMPENWKKIVCCEFLWNKRYHFRLRIPSFFRRPKLHSILSTASVRSPCRWEQELAEYSPLWTSTTSGKKVVQNKTKSNRKIPCPIQVPS